LAKRKRRDQQHLRQESTRRKSYSVGSTAPNEVYKPGFPMSMFGNVKIFAAIGVVIVAIFIVTAIWTNPGRQNASAPDFTPTPTGSATATASTTASPSATPLTFTAAEDVVEEATNDYTATVKTSKGDFTIRLFATEAPNTVNNFVFLAEKGYFNNITFHRVANGFVIQSGDPQGGRGPGPGYTTNDETSEIRNTRGTIAMAKAGTNKFFGSQWFINLKDNPGLDFDGGASNQFYPFGEVTSGMDVVDAIGAVTVETPPDGKPVEDITISTVEITETPKS
jgi:cyclophilin family peptidyl-prolyl cis-trans isomerase